MSDQDQIQRNILPIPDRPRTGLITYDAKDPETHYPAITQLRPPKGAPNVLIILIDDAGFGSRVRLAVHAPHRTSRNWPRTDSSTTAFIPPRSARPRDRRC